MNRYLQRALLLLLAAILPFTLAACNPASQKNVSTACNEQSAASVILPEPVPLASTGATSKSSFVNLPSSGSEETADGKPAVYMTNDISPQGLLAIYKALGRQAKGNVAVKISTGEPGSHFLDANLIKDWYRRLMER